jgi:hypothetical protein
MILHVVREFFFSFSIFLVSKWITPFWKILDTNNDLECSKQLIIIESMTSNLFIINNYHRFVKLRTLTQSKT